MRRTFASCAFFMALGVGSLLADRQIGFVSSIGPVNNTSAGSGVPMGDDFAFELGGFDASGGWSPSAANTGEWASRWQAVGRASYSPVGSSGSGWFTGSTSISDNASPFGTSDPVYIWGFNVSGEWILMTNPAWAWPTVAGGDLSQPVEIFVSEAGTTAVVGSVSPDASAGYQMMSVAVTGEIPKTAPELWQVQYFNALERADPSVSGWYEDPDEDGAMNIEELAAGTDPLDPDSVQLANLSFEQVGDSTYSQAELVRKGRADIEHIFALSTDLVDWDQTGASVVTVEDSDSRLILRSSNAVAAATREFYRLILVNP